MSYYYDNATEVSRMAIFVGILIVAVVVVVIVAAAAAVEYFANIDVCAYLYSHYHYVQYFSVTQIRHYSYLSPHFLHLI